MRYLISRYPGKQVKIINNVSGHSFRTGEDVRVISVIPTGNVNPKKAYKIYVESIGSGRNSQVYLEDLTVPLITKDEMEKGIKEAEQQIQFCKDALVHMEALETTEVSETDFTVINLLKKLDKPGVTRLQKIKEISKLVEIK